MHSQMTTEFPAVQTLRTANLRPRDADSSIFNACTRRKEARKTISQLHSYYAGAIAVTATACIMPDCKQGLLSSHRFEAGARSAAKPALQSYGKDMMGAQRRARRARVSDVATRTKSWVSQVGSAVTDFSNHLRPPRQRPNRRLEAEVPIVPYWAVCVAVDAFIFSFLALLWPFMATPDGEPTALDAAVRTCESNSIVRMVRWLLIAMALCSGICVMHPVQSGLALSV